MTNELTTADRDWTTEPFHFSSLPPADFAIRHATFVQVP
jgi:hypothetical protein